MKLMLVVASTKFNVYGLTNPLGVLSIATYLRANGHDAMVFDRNVEKTSFEKAMLDYNPDVVGVSIMSSRMLKDAVKISKIAKKHGKVVEWGGQIPTMYPELCLGGCKELDYITMNEGELTTLEFMDRLAAGLSPDDIDGIAYRDRENSEKIVITKCREFANLDDIPTIDWTLVDPNCYIKKRFICERSIHLFSGKGCPFNCTFCASRAYHRFRHRQRSARFVLDEIEFLVKNYNIDGVDFTDELWCASNEAVVEFCEELKKRNFSNFVWSINARAGLYNREQFQMMYDAGCRCVSFGVESGSPEVLDRIHKQIDLKLLEENISDCVDIGIVPTTTYIVGFPGETCEQLRETVNVFLKMKGKMAIAHHFYPIPGSDLYKELVANGRYAPPLSLKQLQKEIATTVLKENFSEIPSKDLRVVRCFFHWVTFTAKDAVKSGRSFAFATQAIAYAFKIITQKGFLNFIISSFGAAHTFLYVLWHVTMYPGVRKKYGLYLKNKN